MLVVDRLSGGYVPGRPAIRDISFTIRRHEIVGLIGLNGAGKSTVIKHVLGFLQPASGSVRFTGVDEPIRAYVPETPELYEEMTLWEHLEFTASSYGLDEASFRPRAEELLERFRMKEKRHHFPGSYSKGMRQKVMLLCAFLVRPDLLVVDEPFIGLDPLATEALLALLTELKAGGTAILLSTHVLGLAEKYVDRFVLMHGGEMALSGTIGEMREQAGLPAASLDDLFLHVARR